MVQLVLDHRSSVRLLSIRAFAATYNVIAVPGLAEILELSFLALVVHDVVYGFGVLRCSDAVPFSS